MPPSSPPSLTQELAAALEWWREAGVDRAFRDESEGWLADLVDEEDAADPAPTHPAKPKPDAPTVSRIGGNPANWPQDLPAFPQWWLTEPTLDDGGISPRVAPRGAPEAELMVIVAMPEQGDGDRLLSGEQGHFLDAILQACGLADEAVYLASALPRHTPVPNGEELRTGGLGEVLEHHVRLVAPKRLLAFGRLVPPLLGHGTAQGPAATPIFNHEGLRVPVMAAGGLDRLLRSAAAREAFWRRWLDWTDT